MARDATAPWAEEVLVTVDELIAMMNKAWQYELVRGRLVRMPPAGLENGAIAVRLAAALLRFADSRRLGTVTGAETGFLLSPPGEPDTVLALDVAFIAVNRLPPSDSRDWTWFPRLAPDLVLA